MPIRFKVHTPRHRGRVISRRRLVGVVAPKKNVPTISFRDIVLQRRDDDLVPEIEFSPASDADDEISDDDDDVTARAAAA